MRCMCLCPGFRGRGFGPGFANDGVQKPQQDSSQSATRPSNRSHSETKRDDTQSLQKQKVCEGAETWPANRPQQDACKGETWPSNRQQQGGAELLNRCHTGEVKKASSDKQLSRRRDRGENLTTELGPNLSFPRGLRGENIPVKLEHGCKEGPIKFEVSPVATMLEVKDSVGSKVQIPCDQFDLLLRLDDDKRLKTLSSKVGIKDGTIVVWKKQSTSSVEQSTSSVAPFLPEDVRREKLDSIRKACEGHELLKEDCIKTGIKSMPSKKCRELLDTAERLRKMGRKSSAPFVEQFCRGILHLFPEARKEVRSLDDSQDPAFNKFLLTFIREYKWDFMDLEHSKYVTIKIQKFVDEVKAQVKAIPDGSAAKVAMFSARFDKGPVEQKYREVYRILKENNYPVRMVASQIGESFGHETLEYLDDIHENRGIMICVCTADYCECTESAWCSYKEVEYCVNYNVKMWPLQEAPEFPPQKAGKTGKKLLRYVFQKCRVYQDCQSMNAMEVAKFLADSLLEAAEPKS